MKCHYTLFKDHEVNASINLWYLYLYFPIEEEWNFPKHYCVVYTVNGINGKLWWRIILIEDNAPSEHGSSEYIIWDSEIVYYSAEEAIFSELDSIMEFLINEHNVNRDTIFWESKK